MKDALDRGTLVINEIEASNRAEMRCPDCGKASIEAHPSASEYPTKKAAILKASQCGNPSCGRGLLSPDEVDKQYEPAGVASSISIKGVAQIVFALLVVALIAGFFMGYFDDIVAAPTTTVEGAVTNGSGEPLANAQVSLVDSDATATTNSNGEYTFEEVEVGQYLLQVNPAEDSSARAIAIEIDLSRNGIEVTDEFIPSDLYSTEGTSIEISTPQSRTVSRDGTSQDGAIPVTYFSDQNRGELNVEISPLSQGDLETTLSREVSLGEEITLDIQGTIVDTTLIGIGDITTDQRSDTGTATNGQATVTVDGSMAPADAQIELGEGAGVSQQQETFELSSGETQTLTIDGDLTQSMDVTLRGGATEAPQQQDGVWSPSDGPLELDLDPSDAPSTVTLTLEGDVSTQQESVTGQLSQSEETITVDPNGSISPVESVITFTGGDVQSEQIASGSLSGSAEDQEQELTTELETVDSSGTYRLSYDFSILTGPAYVDGGYSINGNQTSVSSGTDTVTIDLSEGDTVGLWLEVEQEELERVNHNDTSSIEVTQVEVQTTQAEVGEDIGVRATVENTGSSSDSTTVVAYSEGVQWDQQTVELSPEETETITFDRVSFDEEGVFPIQINDSSITKVEVGSGDLEYGEGDISGDLEYLAEDGTVEVDTNGDGTTDCEVSAETGDCELNLDLGSNSVLLNQQNVSNTSYEITYTARSGARDVKADLDGDGNYEVNHSGVLSDGQTASDSVTLDAGTHEIDIETGNGESIPYTLEWTESGVISSPTIYVNGEEAVSVSETYQGSRDFTIDPSYFNSGENTIRLETEDDAVHTLELGWNEQSDTTYPSVELADSGQQLCSSTEFSQDNVCTIDPTLLQPGDQQIIFNREGQNVGDLTFTFTHTARAVPSELVLTNTDSGSRVNFTRINAQDRTSTGWEHTKSQSLQTDATYTLTTPTSTDMSLSGRVNMELTTRREQAVHPTIIITHEDGSTEEIPISERHLDSDGELVESATVTIPPDSLERGVNEITFVSENEGVYKVEINGSEDHGG